mmetsp:Transcript_14454/g.39931  ORF Transcript_14454/g.39931 Transcript_14454/m.39931 type:complete len:294 (+) Transcript_14454:209-1090(+)
MPLSPPIPTPCAPRLHTGAPTAGAGSGGPALARARLRLWREVRARVPVRRRPGGVGARGVVLVGAGRRARAPARVGARPGAPPLGGAELPALGHAAPEAAAAAHLGVLGKAHVLGEERQAVAGGGVAGQEPEEDVVAQHGLGVAQKSPVVGGRVIPRPLHRLLAELDGGHRLEHQPDMEAEKDGDQEAQEAGEGLPEEEQEHRHEGCPGVRRSPHRFHHRPDDEVAVDSGVQEEQEEVLVVPEAHAVVDPRAVVVHLEDAHTAHAAMVAPVWLELGTPLAVAPVSTALGFLQV